MNLTQVQEAVLEEPFHGVRAKVASALGKSKTLGAVRVLLEMLRKEKDARCLAAIVEGLRIKDEEVRNGVKDVLERGELPYRYVATTAHGGHGYFERKYTLTLFIQRPRSSIRNPRSPTQSQRLGLPAFRSKRRR